jgi:regulatory protein
VARRNRLGYDREALYEYAVRILARQSLTAAELRRRLERRAARPPDVEEVIGRLSDVGYLDDRRVAESYSRFRHDYEGLGKQRVLADLRRRGVDDPLAESAVAEVYQDTDELELVRRHLRRKLGRDAPGQRIEDRKRLAALFRGLLRAGFSSARIVEGLREISSDGDWLEAFADQHPEPSEDEGIFD